MNPTCYNNRYRHFIQEIQEMWPVKALSNANAFLMANIFGDITVFMDCKYNCQFMRRYVS